MRLNLISLISFSLLATLFISCGDDEPTTDNLTLNISGLEDLGESAVYEGWIMVDGAPQTTGTFTVNESGDLSKNSFELDAEALEKATAFILTVEPSPDPSPAPSDVHILAGDFSENEAGLTIGHEAALGNDFSSSAGKYILATPTDMDDSNEASGIWFLDNSSGAPEVGLELPTLPAGWAYEGWAVIDGIPVSTGTFTSVTGQDDSAVFSGAGGPPFPGEDFLNDAPAGLSFPTDLSGGKAVISIEPVPDNSPDPFVLKPLVGDIPAAAPVHSVLTIDQHLNFPTGSASK